MAQRPMIHSLAYEIQACRREFGAWRDFLMESGNNHLT